jgi:release factor glutamine methyltransferase
MCPFMSFPSDVAPALLYWATEELRSAGVPRPRQDARALVDDALQVLQAGVRRREAREPLEYVRRRTVFRGLELEIDARVFIPRPETELLVEAALALPRGATVLDPCTGSGAVALALKHERPDLDVTATDRSAAAIDVARANAQRLGLRVHFAVADGVSGAYHAIVSNPPYVAETEAGTGSLPPELEHHEPPDAFWGGPDGLAFYRRLVRELGSASFVALEVGDGQADAVCALLAQAGLRCTARLRAPSGAVRVVVAERAAP